MASASLLTATIMVLTCVEVMELEEVVASFAVPVGWSIVFAPYKRGLLILVVIS
jgi:hypothetical protein